MTCLHHRHKRKAESTAEDSVFLFVQKEAKMSKTKNAKKTQPHSQSATKQVKSGLTRGCASYVKRHSHAQSHSHGKEATGERKRSVASLAVGFSFQEMGGPSGGKTRPPLGGVVPYSGVILECLRRMEV